MGTDGRPCAACSHPERAAIDAALLAGDSLRTVAAHVHISASALGNHKRRHLGKLAAHGENLARRGYAAKVEALVDAKAEAAAEADVLAAVNINRELHRMLDRVNKLFDACDEYLTDPERPGQYTLLPRAHEIEVVYGEPVIGPLGRRQLVERKGTLAELLLRLEAEQCAPECGCEGRNGLGIVTWTVKIKHADPRTLVLSTVKRLEGMQQWLTKLVLATRDDAKVGAEAFTEEEAAAMRDEIVAALEEYPEARVKVAERLRKWLH